MYDKSEGPLKQLDREGYTYEREGSNHLIPNIPPKCVKSVVALPGTIKLFDDNNIELVLDSINHKSILRITKEQLNKDISLMCGIVIDKKCLEKVGKFAVLKDVTIHYEKEKKHAKLDNEDKSFFKSSNGKTIFEKNILKEKKVENVEIECEYESNEGNKFKSKIKRAIIGEPNSNNGPFQKYVIAIAILVVSFTLSAIAIVVIVYIKKSKRLRKNLSISSSSYSSSMGLSSENFSVVNSQSKTKKKGQINKSNGNKKTSLSTSGSVQKNLSNNVSILKSSTSSCNSKESLLHSVPPSK
uniref:Ephrin RBD domain-containing protein n=1 Tax=Parastrongyloides trichosuri TaxID=131310 RepID=A0A0N5A4I9_PARTI